MPRVFKRENTVMPLLHLYLETTYIFIHWIDNRFMISASKKIVSNETKKDLFVRYV